MGLSLKSHDHARTAKTLAFGLGWLSIALGVTELVAPRHVSRAIGRRDPDRLLQAYGLREIVTGVGLLMSRNPTPWLWGRVAGDVLDMLAVAPGRRTGGSAQGRTGVALGAIAIIALLDVYSASQSRTRAIRAPMRDYSGRSGFPEAPERMRGAALNGRARGLDDSRHDES